MTKNADSGTSRRIFLATAGAGAAALALPRGARAAALTPAEKANVKVVNDFCALFTAPIDWDRMATFLTADCIYRPTQTMDPVTGPEAIVGMLRGFAGSATASEFEVLDTWARGPVVANDRIDRFTLPDQSMEIPVVGVFHMIDGKIAEWTDFTF